MRKTSANRRAENTNNARRYNGGKGNDRISAHHARRAEPDPGDGRIQCVECFRWVKPRADGTMRAHVASPGVSCAGAVPAIGPTRLCEHGNAPLERKNTCRCPVRQRCA